MADQPDFSQFTLMLKGHSFEDFKEGQVFEHHWGRTINAGDNSLFTTATLAHNPLYFNAEYARAHGHPDVVVNPMLVACTVVGVPHFMFLFVRQCQNPQRKNFVDFGSVKQIARAFGSNLRIVVKNDR